MVSGRREFLHCPGRSGGGQRLAAYMSPGAADAPTTSYSIEIVLVMCFYVMYGQGIETNF
jgi:hypothetical protein